MSQPFTFPPPPPPPPKVSQNNTSAATFQSRGGRGRGNTHSRGRGRGQYPGHQNQRGGFSGRGNGLNDGQQHQYMSVNQGGSYATQNGRHSAGQKRDRTTAFQQQQSDDALRKHRPLAPPAVPSFGVNFDALLSKSTTSTQSPKTNALGLTPRATGHESDEDDEDEEAKLASKGIVNGALQFEYQGQTSTLNSSEDIAAWIAERRKKWPTEAKRVAAVREAEEKRRKWQEEKDARVKASQAIAKARQEEYQKQKADREKSRVRQKLLQEHVEKAREQAASKVSQSNAEAKAERLRRKAEKIARQLEAAEKALQRKEQHEGEEDDIDALMNKVDKVAAKQEGMADLDDDLATISSSSDSDADDTSSSGSSESDADADSGSEPEQLSTKRSAPERVLAPVRRTAPGATPDTRQPCQKFVRTGQCKFGRKCRFRHDKADRKAALQKETGIGNRRKGLYQIMVDKEAEEEQKRVLRAIIAMGDAGLLGDISDMQRKGEDV